MPLTVAAGSGGESAENYIRIVHEVPPDTSGGATLADTWEVRPLTNITDDAAGLAGLAGSVITLAAGTYRVRIESVTFGVLRSTTRLRSLAGPIYPGNNNHPPAGQQRPSWIITKFTIAAPTSYVIEQRSFGANPFYGWGIEVPNSGTNQIYCVAEFFQTPP